MNSFDIANIVKPEFLFIFALLFVIAILFPANKKKPYSSSEARRLQRLLSEINAEIDVYNIHRLEFNKLFQQAAEEGYRSPNTDTDFLTELAYYKKEASAIEEIFNIAYDDVDSYIERKKFKAIENFAELTYRSSDEYKLLCEQLSAFINEYSEREPLFSREESACQSETDFNNTSAGFFADCDNIENLEKRYRILAKGFHPDSGCGSNELFTKMKDEYEDKKRSLL